MNWHPCHVVCCNTNGTLIGCKLNSGWFSLLAQELFELEERVRAIVLGMEDDFSRISCSTAHLEEEPGDMVKDRQYVYDHAEEQVTSIQEELRALKKKGKRVRVQHAACSSGWNSVCDCVR